MADRVGLWIDHKTAVIVTVNGQGESLRKIESGAKHLEYRGAPRPKTAYSAQYSQGDDQLDNQYLQHLHKYYEQVVAANGGNCPELATVRSLQKDFLKGRGKFPDFIDIGIDIWDALVDWHVRTRQQLQVQRTAEGRYAMPVFQTNLVLRHDVGNLYVGPPYDAK